MAKKLCVGDFIVLGKGEKKSGGSSRPSTLSDAMEAIIAAVYLDGGFEAAKRLVLSNLSDDIDELAKADNIVSNYKSDLQEYVQSKGKELYYEVLSEEGPEHAKSFEVAAFVDGTMISKGKGTSKKKAEQEAARIAYLKLKKI